MALIKNINAWRVKTKKQKEAIRLKAGVYVQRKAMSVLKDALMVSPQWSGNYAYNWNIEITGFSGGSYSPRYKNKNNGSWFLENPKKAGDPEAINAALAWNEEIIENVKWNSRITLVNRAPVAEMIEAGTVNLRPENLIPGGMGVIAYLKTKYSFAI